MLKFDCLYIDKCELVNVIKDKKILFVCSGNTCRSPMAEYLFRTFLNENKISNIECKSAGIHAQNGSAPSIGAIRALNELDIDLSSHRSSSILNLNLSDYDLFVTMNEHLLNSLVSLGVDSRRIYVLNKESGGILDPFGGDLVVYKKVRDDIRLSLKKLLVFIQKLNRIDNLKIFKASNIYLDQIYKIEKESFTDSWSSKSLESEFSNKSTCFLVAVSGNEVLGYALEKLCLEMADILKIAVKSSFRRLGISKLLLNALILNDLDFKIKKIFLEVRVSNIAAINLYKSFGFKIISTRKDFYSSPKEDAFLMLKQCQS